MLYLALSSPRLDTRRATHDVLRAIVTAYPVAGSTILRDALTHSLSRPSSSANLRYTPLLSLAAPAADAADDATRSGLVVELLVLAHEDKIVGQQHGQMWTDLVRRAGLDPRALAEVHVERLLALVLDATPATDAHMAAVTTLTGILPSVFLPRFVERIEKALGPVNLRSVSEEDMQVWRTPAGELCVDGESFSFAMLFIWLIRWESVLAAKKGAASANAPKKGKDADIQRWEAELRDSLAKKKAASSSNALANLSKPDRALVDAQLAKEAHIRARVDGVRKTLEKGLALVRCVVRAGVPECAPFLGVLAQLLLAPGGVLRVGHGLVGPAGAETYLVSLFDCSCSSPPLKLYKGYHCLYRPSSGYFPRSSGHRDSALAEDSRDSGRIQRRATFWARAPRTVPPAQSLRETGVRWGDPWACDDHDGRSRTGRRDRLWRGTRRGARGRAGEGGKVGASRTRRRGDFIPHSELYVFSTMPCVSSSER